MARSCAWASGASGGCAQPDRGSRARGSVRSSDILRTALGASLTAVEMLFEKLRPCRSGPRYTPSSARRRPWAQGRKRSSSEGSPFGIGSTVFENSTACAPSIRMDRGVRPGSTRRRERLERSRATAKSQVEKYPVMVRDHVYRSRPAGALGLRHLHDRLFVKFFTESLILAQDERWRRA